MLDNEIRNMYNAPPAFIMKQLFTFAHPDIATLIICVHTTFIMEDGVMNLFTWLEFWWDCGLHIIALVSVAIPIEHKSV